MLLVMTSAEHQHNPPARVHAVGIDPDGDDTIVMSESRFKKFMEEVEGVAEHGFSIDTGDDEQESGDAVSEMEDFEKTPAPAASEIKAPQPAATGPKPQSTPIPGDEDVAPKGNDREPGTAAVADAMASAATSQRSPSANPAPQSPQQLVQSGVSFLTGLAETLKNPEKTQELVQSVIARDETTGQTYLKIPVESAAVVQNVFQLLGSLLGK